MQVAFASGSVQASVEELAALTGAVGAVPADYARFLAHVGSGRLALNEYVGESEVAADIGVGVVYAPGDIGDPQAWWADRIPAGFIGIADSAGGNLICLSLRPQDHGTVYFWDHGLEAEDGEVADMSNMVLVAHSFAQFIDALRPVDISQVPESEGTAWVDPEFARELLDETPQ